MYNKNLDEIKIKIPSLNTTIINSFYDLIIDYYENIDLSNVKITHNISLIKTQNEKEEIYDLLLESNFIKILNFVVQIKFLINYV